MRASAPVEADAFKQSVRSGLAVTRYILKAPPVVAMDRAQLVRLLGPTMQRYIVGEL